MNSKILFMIFAMMISITAFAENDTAPLKSFEWLAGCWSGGKAPNEVMEVWMKPAGNAMLGMSRTLANQKMKQHEFMQIVQEDSGIYFIAQPSGQPKASFKLISDPATKHLIFENADHDFPQRVIYRLESENSLKARIEGKMKGEEKGFDYPYTRTACN